ncbi:MAG: hypothetical protein JWP29_2976, partial [Rhodoferax sp.]|nr:hypothetical protein [Rhodoferax sp.]
SLGAIDGTSWSNVNTAPVRVDFGAAYGFGTITVSSIGGGSYLNNGSVYAGEQHPDLDIGNGNTLNVLTESIFVLGHGNTTASGSLAGVTVDVKLDSGSFAAGTLVDIRSLDWTGANVHQYFSPGMSLTTPYATQLPTDFNSGTAVATTLMGSDGSGDLYGASTPGVGSGLAFPLATDAAEFSFRLLTTDTYGGGVAWSIALPDASSSQVPEPESLPLMLAGLGLLGVSLRGRKAKAG